MRLASWVWAWPLLGLAAGCTPKERVPEFKIPAFCEQQVYADPAVRLELDKDLGSEYYRDTHKADLAYAKIDALNRCLRQRGLVPAGGGVEQPRREGR